MLNNQIVTYANDICKCSHQFYVQSDIICEYDRTPRESNLVVRDKIARDHFRKFSPCGIFRNLVLLLLFLPEVHNVAHEILSSRDLQLEELQTANSRNTSNELSSSIRLYSLQTIVFPGASVDKRISPVSSSWSRLL